MRCKAFEAVIELEVQAVTCPGVWLCPNGKEIVYIELIQWENSELGNVLATFKTSLTDLLYPLPCCKGLIAGVDVDLLMEATKRFPGIIAPKIEVSTKTTIEEVLCTYKNDKKKDLIVVNPKIISSKCVPKRKTPLRQKRVCHSYQYHKTKMGVRRCLSDRRDESDMLPTSEHLEEEGTCILLDKEKVKEKIENIRSNSSSGTDCLCHLEGKKVLCPLCTKYKYYFDKSCSGSIGKGSIVLCPCKMLKCHCNNEHGEQLHKASNRFKCESKFCTSIRQHQNSNYGEHLNINLTQEIHNRCQKTLSPQSFSTVSPEECIRKKKSNNPSLGTV